MKHSLLAASGIVSKPDAVDEALLTATSVLLRWDEPIDPNGDITEYRINVEAISTTRVEQEDGRKKRQTNMPSVDTRCISGGVGNVNRNFTNQGPMPARERRLDDLSEFSCP